MATNQKISELNVLTGSNLDSIVDWLPVVDTSDVETKKIAPKELIDGYVNINPLLVGNTLSLKNSSASLVQNAAMVTASQTNAGIILNTNNNGPLMRIAPDNTNFGGNARGLFSVDLQKTRNNADEVASGDYSTVGGGVSNKASGVYSIVCGGQQNRATGSNGITAGGLNNDNTGSRGFIGGGEGNTVSSTHSTVSGGQSNTASTGTHATVAGGSGNTASGQRSIVIGGQNNTASGQLSICGGGTNAATGQFAVCIGGQNNQSTNTASTTIGGENNIASGQYGFATGFQSKAYLYSQFSNASGLFAANGDAQQSLLTARRSASLTTAATTVLSLDGTGTTNLIIPNGNNRAWKVKAEWIGIVSVITGTATGITVGDTVYGESNFGFRRLAGTSSVRNFISDQQASDSTIMDTCSLVYSAGASQELALTFTGPTFAGGGSVTMRVVAKLSLVEVAY